MSNRNSGLRPCAMALAVALALGLTGCSGGGSNVRPSTPAPPPPPPGPGTGSDGGSVTVAAGTTLSVNHSDSILKPIVLKQHAVLDNAGTVGGAVGIAVEGKALESADAVVRNHDGGSIKATDAAVWLRDRGSVSNSSGGIIEGGTLGVSLGAGGHITNDGVGSLLRSTNGIAVQILGDSGSVVNTGGGSITGASTAVYLQYGGSVTNGSGSTIQTTGTAAGDCGVGGDCAIFVASDSGTASNAGGSLTLVNAGTIIGNVQMMQTAANLVTLSSGSAIAGDLAIGSNHQSSLTLDGGAGTYQLYSQAVTGTTTFAGKLLKTGDGVWIIDNDDLAADTTSINGGTLQIGNGGTQGSIGQGDIDISGGDLAFSRSDDVAYSGDISGAGKLIQAGSGTLTLSGANSYLGGTTISHGTLQIGSGGTTGSIVGDVIDNGFLGFNRSNDTSFAGRINGTGGLIQSGPGSLTLTGLNAYTGTTQVNAGSLYIDGDQTDATGNTTIISGATFGGMGIVGGDVNVGNGATLSPGSRGGVGTLTINGNLALSAGSILDYSFGQADVVGGPLNDLTNVNGDLMLDGTLSISIASNGSFDPGIYRLFNYTGSLTNSGLATALPSSGVLVQTVVAHQVNLINTDGMAYSFWDGGMGPKNDDAINGGDGVWEKSNSLTLNNWTDVNGAVNAAFADRSFAVFQGAPGTVTVDDGNGDINVAGMQFASNGYVLQGDSIHLVGSATDPTRSIIRVGDGTTAGASFKAIINSQIGGDVMLVKIDAGTLVLTQNNIYTGGTTISEGTLQIGDGGTSGSIVGDVTNNGSLAFDRSDNFIFDGEISGNGSLTQLGTGSLILTGFNEYKGGITIRRGTLQVGDGVAANSISGDISNNGALVFSTGSNPDGVSEYSNVISGSGSVVKTGEGRLVLTNDSTYTGGTTISQGTLQIGELGGQIGTTGSIFGDVTNNGSLVFARRGDFTFNAIISGTGSLEETGNSTLILTADHSYTGGTIVSSGTLQIGNGGTTGSIIGDVLDNTYYGSLTFNRSDDWTYHGVISGSGGVVKLGGGTLTLTGANTFGGRLYVKDGALKLVSGAAMAGAITVGGAGQNARLEVENGGILSAQVTIEDQGSLNNAGAVVSTAPGSSAVQGYSNNSTIVVSNHDGGLLQGDYSQPGYNIPAVKLGTNSTLANSSGSTIHGYTGVTTGGIVNNFSSSIIGETGDGIADATVVNNSDGGSILGGANPNPLIDISIGVKTSATDASVNNLGGSSIRGGLGGVKLFGGGSVTNDGGSIISGGTGISITGSSGAPSIVNNTGGSTITGKSIGVALYDGGLITNGRGSTIEATATASGDCAVTPSCSIFVPAYSASGSNETHGTLSLTNAGYIVGDVQMDPSVVNNVNLIAGGFIHGALKIGSNAQSTLTLDGNVGTIQLYSNAVTGTTIFGGILVKDGGGTWVVDSSNLQGIVNTSVNAGSLQATQTISGNVTVNVSGNLDGVPGVAGNLTNAGKVAVHGGDSSVGGNYAQSSAGSLAVSLGSKLNVTGTAALNGGTLEVTGADTGYVANSHTDVLTATGGVSGTFDQLVKDTGVIFTATTINYDANSVWLDTTGLNVTKAAAGNGVSYTDTSMASARRVQGAFEQVNHTIASGDGSKVSADFVHAAGQFQQAPNLQAAQASLQSLSGQLHAVSAAMTFKAIDASSRALSDRFDNVLGKANGFGMWMQNLNVGGDMARSGYNGVGFQLSGWLVGSDRKIGRSGVAGFAFGQNRGHQQLNQSYDHDNSRSTEGMLYAGWLSGNWYTQGRVGFGQFQQDVNRRLLLGYSAQNVQTGYEGRYGAAYGESGLRFEPGHSQITPYVNVEYARIGRDGFAEQGAGGFGLRSNAQTLDRWQAGLGLRAAHHWNLDGGRTVDFNLRAQWQRTLASHGDVFDASFVGLREWQPLVGIGLSRYSALIGIGLDARLSAHTALNFGYDYETGQRDNAQTLSARFKLTF